MFALFSEERCSYSLQSITGLERYLVDLRQEHIRIELRCSGIVFCGSNFHVALIFVVECNHEN